MMDDHWYLTKEDYEIARSNGISRKLAYGRVYNGMKVSEAITRPVTPNQKKGEGLWGLWKDKSEVSVTTFYRSLKAGLPPEEAIKRQPKVKTWKVNKPIPEWVYEQAATLGVSRKTVYHRITILDWTEEQAATTAPIPRNERKRHKKQKGGWR